MPIYEYCCEACGEKFEKLVRSTSKQQPLTCPHCGSERVEKAISLFGVGNVSHSSGSAGCSPTSSV
ncbi:MAG: zinc ribbon domain-containing protein [Anaerolineae bacterium]|nr:zinc ribbon domain-containing protein [Anaerolineae bacterium]